MGHLLLVTLGTLCLSFSSPLVEAQRRFLVQEFVRELRPSWPCAAERFVAPFGQQMPTAPSRLEPLGGSMNFWGCCSPPVRRLPCIKYLCSISMYRVPQLMPE